MEPRDASDIDGENREVAMRGSEGVKAFGVQFAAGRIHRGGHFNASTAIYYRPVLALLSDATHFRSWNLPDHQSGPGAFPFCSGAKQRTDGGRKHPDSQTGIRRSWRAQADRFAQF